MSETYPKQSATTGVVKAMEPMELDTPAITNLTKEFRRRFSSPRRSFLSSHL